MPFSGRPRRHPWKPCQPSLGAALERDEVPAIEVVRAVAGPIVGAVTSHFFGPRRRDLA